ncbi:MAG: YggT family protein [Chloroflexi bacterium]|nr:YggT family protein [Chloroflexota bacterium]
MCVECAITTFVFGFITVVFGALRVAILVQVLRSWVRLRLPWGLDRFITDITEPVLGPIRRALPFMGGMDFSPLIALLALGFVESLIRGFVPRFP